jgi:hypothetical protein
MPSTSGSRRRSLFRRVTLWVPTWRLTVPALLGLSLVLFIVLRSTHAFLSMNAPVPANLLVVEGWAPDYALEQAAKEFERGDYTLLIASGGPLESGSHLSRYKTYAELAELSLREIGMQPRQVVAAPAEKVYRNRTFVSAISVRDLIAEQSLDARGLNVVSVGAHARRSWVVYRKVLGDTCPVGVISFPPQDYDPDRWWASSDGAKQTLTEVIGWLYEVVFNSGRGK